jgi:hypothetical protein
MYYVMWYCFKFFTLFKFYRLHFIRPRVDSSLTLFKILKFAVEWLILVVPKFEFRSGAWLPWLLSFWFSSIPKDRWWTVLENISWSCLVACFPNHHSRLSIRHCVTYAVEKASLNKLRNSRTPRCRWEDNIRMDLGEIGWDVVDWIYLA